MKLVQGSASLMLPADYTWVSGKYTKNHTAYDFGFLKDFPGSLNQPLKSVSDATVVKHSKYSDGGYAVAIGWDAYGHTFFAEYMHNKGASNLKVGTNVKQGDQIAVMGDSGNPGSYHVHFILIKAPLGSTFSNSALRDYRIEPKDYPGGMFVYPGQVLSEGSKIKLPDFKEPAKDLAVIKKGAKSKSLNAKYNNKTISSSATGVPKKYELGKVKGKDWVYFPDIQTYVAFNDVEFTNDIRPKPTPKPTPTPSPKPRKAVVGGYQMLYKNGTGSANYGVPGVKQNLKTRTLNILDENTTRVRVDVSKEDAFDVNSFWVDKSGVKLL